MLGSHSLGKERGRAIQIAVAFVAAALLAALLSLAGPPQAKADAPNLTTRSGITAGANRWISPRSFDVDISTPYIAANSINGGVNRVRVTLPDGYFNSPNARYPVIYLLHGGAGGSSRQWTTEGGAAEYISAGKNVIIVSPEGGKVGWYTNWQNQSKGAQRWADFILNQMIPFIDGNLRTIATKQARGIAGLSMGGYGAIRLTQDRPDLFGAVGSFSGALDLSDLGTRIVINEQSVENGYGMSDAFGSKWDTFDPVKRGAAMFKNQNIMILLYAGSGIHDADVLERSMGNSTNNFSKVLTKAGINHMWWMYGRPGPSSPFGCDGGHNFTCWNFALNDAMPRMLGYLTKATNVAPPPPPPPAGTNVVSNGGFESGLAPWACQATCGRDANGLARTGVGNAWVRNTSGWNDVHQRVNVDANRNYRVTGWIRTSANNADGYFGLRSASGQILGERKYGRFDGYTKIEFDVNAGNNTQLDVYAGLWANGDTWAQVDDISVVAL
jgi:S-formylglutathione hydrolase FrmB